VTFDETTPCPRDVFECAGDKEMKEGIFVDEELQGFDGDEDESLRPSTSSPEPVAASILEAEAHQATTSSHIQKAHPHLKHHGLRGGGHFHLGTSFSHSEGTSNSTNHR
jgi:hypothetical protein